MRGNQIKNRDMFTQQVVFFELKKAKSTQVGWSMSDVDFEYEDGKFWIRGEVKKRGTELGYGQKLLIERFCDGMETHETYGFLLWHDVSKDEDIDISECIVHSVYRNGKWYNKLGDNLKFGYAFKKIAP